jgi:P27 family predicted phage terminase small subunit
MKKARKPRMRRSPQSGVNPLIAAPPPPKSLGKEAAEYWKQAASLLVERRHLTSLHLAAFEALCISWGDYLSLRKWLGDDPARWTFTTESGYEQETPQYRAMLNALKTCQHLWAKFGLTPASEGRIGGAKTPPAGQALVAVASAKTVHDEKYRPK